LTQVSRERNAGLEGRGLHWITASKDSNPTPNNWAQQCDPFSQFLAQGLSGACDLRNENGDANNFVEFRELRSWVASRVADWSVRHRNRSQTVGSWSSDDHSTRLTWRLNESKRTAAATANAMLEPRPDQRELLQSLWDSASQLQRQQIWSDHPAEWQKLTRGLVWLEQLCFGGAKGRKHFDTAAPTFSQQIEWLLEQRRTPTHEHPIDARVAQATQLAWQTIAQNPQRETIFQLHQEWQRKPASDLDSVPFLVSITNAPMNQLLGNQSLLAEYSRLQVDASSYELKHLQRRRPEIGRVTELRNEALTQQLHFEDAVLAGQAEVVLRQKLDEFRNSLKRWIDFETKLNTRLNDVDQILARLPELAWGLGAIFAEDREAALDVQDQSMMAILFATNMKRQWTESFLESDPNDDSTLKQFLETSESITTALDGLDTRLVEIFEHSATLTAFDPSAIARCESLLGLSCLAEALPSIGTRRMQLRQSLIRRDLRLDVELTMDARTHASARSDRSNPPTSTPSGNEAGQSTAETPLAVDEMWIDSDSEFVRFLAARLQDPDAVNAFSIPEYRAYLRDVFAQELDSIQLDSDTEVADLVHSSFHSRLATSSASGVHTSSAMRQLKRLLMQQRLLSFARRITESFWAGPQRETTPYFAWMSEIALEEIETTSWFSSRNASPSHLVSTANPGAGDQRNEPPQNHAAKLRSRIGDLETFSRDAFDVRATWLPTLIPEATDGRQTARKARDVSTADEAPPGLARLDVRRKAQLASEGPDIAGSLPRGLAFAAVSIGNNTYGSELEFDAQLPGRTATVAVSAESIEQAPVPRGIGNQVDSNRMVAGLYFRGHRFESPIGTLPNAGPKSEVSTSPVTTTTLTIQDTNRSRQRITFVLDCSASMYESVADEFANENGAKNQRTKLDAAKLALLNLLNSLVGQDHEVAVLLYGHRVAQGTVEQGILRQTKYFSQFPFSTDLQAFEDVETILPLGRFAETELQVIRNRLEHVLPWGQTPLYLAAQQAMLGLSVSPDQERVGQHHQIVIISDGKNYQFNPTPEKQLTLESVIARAAETGTQIHVVGFGVPDAEQQASAAEFETLAENTGGSATMQVADASLLVERLKGLTQPTSFDVSLLDGTLTQGQVNRPTSIPVRRVNEKIAIRYLGGTYLVPASPGMNLQMLSTPQRSLVVPRMDKDVLSASLVGDQQGNALPLQAVVHEPTQSNGDLEWRISIQSTLGTLPARPARTLVEITPLNTDMPKPSGIGLDENLLDAFQSYLILDADWLVNSTVHQLSFRTQKWPEGIHKARIQVWLIDDIDAMKRTPDAKLTLKGAAGKEQGPDDSRVTWQIDKSTLSLIVQGEQDAHRKWVPDLISAPTVTRVTRRFNDVQRTAYHQYHFGSLGQQEPQRNNELVHARRLQLTSGPLLPDSTQDVSIQLISLKDLRSRALKTMRPIDVNWDASVGAIPANVGYDDDRN
ncbi:MAG: vWA domain-containing protein, partial [Planctomycetota bacterium]